MRAIRIRVEYGDIRLEVEGKSPEEALKALHMALSQKLPQIRVAAKLVYRPDVAELADQLAGLVAILPQGPRLESAIKATAEEAIQLALLAAYVGEQVGELSKPTLSVRELSVATGKVEKTIRNVLPSLVKAGLIERAGKEYRITLLGAKAASESLMPRLKEAEHVRT